MNDQDLTARIELGGAIVRDAAVMALDYFNRRETLTIDTKKNAQDLVSEADRNVETLIRDGLAEAFPDDGMLGEEHGLQAGTSGWRWIIDPIDGTAPYLHGLRSWSISVAVVFGDDIMAGWIAEPCAGRTYHAAKGRGAWQDDRKLTASKATSMTEGLTAIGSGDADKISRLVHGILSSGGNFQRNGSAALSLAHTAAGHYLGFVEPVLSPWDCAAGLLMVSEAGGYHIPHPLDRPAPVLACAAGVADALKDVIAAAE